MPQLIAFDFVRNWWAWSDDTHVAAQNVEKLWQFVEAGFSQNSSQPGHAPIRAQLVSRPTTVSLIRLGLTFDVFLLKLAMLRVVDAGVHSAKFEKQKHPAIHSHAF